MVGHALRMVASAHGNHTPLALLRSQLGQLVAGAAFLERGGKLQVFEFEKDLGTDDVGQGPRCHERGQQQVALQALGCMLDIS
jgi:hypothetical protein